MTLQPRVISSHFCFMNNFPLRTFTQSTSTESSELLGKGCRTSMSVDFVFSFYFEKLVYYHSLQLEQLNVIGLHRLQNVMLKPKMCICMFCEIYVRQHKHKIWEFKWKAIGCVHKQMEYHQKGWQFFFHYGCNLYRNWQFLLQWSQKEKKNCGYIWSTHCYLYIQLHSIQATDINWIPLGPIYLGNQWITLPS